MPEVVAGAEAIVVALKSRTIPARDAVAQSLAALKVYKLDKRPYLAHLTVARFRRPSRPFALQNVNVPAFHLSQMTLYNSLLERTGAVHTPLAIFPAR